MGARAHPPCGCGATGRRTGLRHRSMRVRIPPSALTPCLRSSTGEHRVPNPGTEVRLRSEASTRHRGREARRAPAKRAHGGSNPPGVSERETMRRGGSTHEHQDFRPDRPAKPGAARALHDRRRRRVRRSLRRPSPGLLAADRRRHRLRGLRLAVGCRLRHRLRQQGGAHRSHPRRPRSARRCRSAHGRDHESHLVRHGRARAGARRPSRAREDPVGRLRTAAQARAARGVAARHRGLGQPLRQPHGGRGGRDLGRRPLRLAWLRPQDGVGLPRPRPGPAVRRPRKRGRDGLAAGALRGRLRARRLVRLGDGARGRVRVRGPRRRRVEGARDPRRRGDARGAQPPQLRVAGGALRPLVLGHPEGLHAGSSGSGGLRRRLDGRRLRHPRGRRRPRGARSRCTRRCTARAA